VLKGPTAIVYGGEGPNAIAKTLAEWSKQDKTLVVKGAVADGEFYDAKGVAALAKMPDKNTLRAMLLTGVLGSARGLATVLAAPGAGLARVLQARIDKQGFAADAAS
jgi:large subunit ribosomal protein L10